MGRKRAVYEYSVGGHEIAEPPRVISIMTPNGGYPSGFVKVEDVPEGEKVDADRDRKTILEGFARHYCEATGLHPENVRMVVRNNGDAMIYFFEKNQVPTPPAPEHSCVVTLSGEDLQAYQDGRHAWGFCKCGKSFSLQKPQPKPESLKSCPLCGCEAKLVEVPDTQYPWVVRCLRCGCRVFGVSGPDAIFAWNRRVTP